ncbi:MAG: TauD/TfdA family dioxygenase, partial [Gammaproteobacteria bacterium]|nr:TauD/TfdA family dioxygenase [Gammaproteobacteria bacterium]
MPVPGHQSLPLSEIGDYRHIQVERAGLALGAFINGVDLSSVQPAAVYAEIADALWRHHVVFLRDQALSAEAHLALASHFGAPEKHEIFQADTRHREISILENDAERPPEINVWHTDVTYRERPSL